jgi:pyruvate/2-oxoglutarate dehydrogenase complex dihydrolipoamide acyltransferase (E2) component
LTTTLSYGQFAPDGSIDVRLFFDHRVMDGADPSAALVELERMLRGPILAELRGDLCRAA